MSKIYIDLEFSELGPDHPIHFISIGMVSEDDNENVKEYYAVSNEFDPKDCNDFVKKNVLPNLELPQKKWKSRKQIAKEIIEFVGDDKDPHFYGYMASYDWVVFCQLFGRMVDLPKNFPMYARDIKQIADELGKPNLPEQKSTEHNAISDAKWTMESHKYLLKLKHMGKKLFNLKDFKELFKNK